jgi:hypothetical protein
MLLIPPSSLPLSSGDRSWSRGRGLTKRLAVLLLLAGSFVFGEPQKARVSGIVIDPSGAVVPGASVALKHADTVVGSVKTDAGGRFLFEQVAPGKYEVEVRVDGFKTARVRATAGKGSSAPLSIPLEVAPVAEEVTVGEGGLSTHPGENRDAATVDRKMLDGLPVFDQDVIATLSGFLDQGAVGSDGVSLVVDGAEANRVLVSPSAIQEVRINQNPYSAEYYRQGRGRIEIITKKEEPEYHGELNVLFRDSSLNARNPFAPQKAPEQRRVYEGNLSGPIGQSKSTTFLLTLDRQEEDLQSIVVAAGPTGGIRANVATPQKTTEFSARVTRQFGAKHTLWAQYALEDRAQTNQGAGGFTLPQAAANFAYHEDDLDVNDRIATSRVVNQIVLHFEWNHGSTTSLNPGTRIVVQDAFTTGGAQADQRQTEMDFKLFDTFSWVLGKHLLKAGIQAAEWSHRTYNDLSNRGGTFFFSSLATYQAGQPYAFTQQTGDGFVPLFQEIVGGFVQDEFQLRPNLSLAFGGRYDYQNFLRRGHLVPRVFAAFAPGSGRAVVLRAGIGLFNDRFPPNAFANLLQHDGSHLNTYLVLNPSYPGLGGTGLLAQPSNIVRFAPTITTPYTIQYSFGAEWAVAAGTTVSATYRASRGVSLLRSHDANAPAGPLYSVRLDPTLGQVRVIETAGRQVGDALELSFRGKVGKRFNGLAQYTLSRTQNNTSGVNFFPANNGDPLGEWGPADFDQRHRLNLLGTVDLRWMKLGIGLNAASGKPYTLTTGIDSNHDGFATDRPFGVGRNTLRIPGYANLDLSLTREIPLSRGRGEKGPSAKVGLSVFNALNSFHAATIEGDESSPFFGQPIAALPARRLQLAAKVSF